MRDEDEEGAMAEVYGLTTRTRADVLGDAADRIAALEATVARLTEKPTHAETFAALSAIKGQRSGAAMYGALTAFLERRIKG